MENLNELLGKLTEFLKSEIKTETIIGQQFQLGAFTCVPVMSVGIGLGSGGGEGKGNSRKTGEGEGGGEIGGAGIGMGPVGFLVTNDKEIQFISTQSSKGINTLFEKAPELLNKFLEKNHDKGVETH
jgi:uncharacterized spore protein YtfJ